MRLSLKVEVVDYMKRTQGVGWAFGMAILLLMAIVPSYTSAEGAEFIVQGNLVDGEDSPISGAVVTVTDLDRDEPNTQRATTDVNGDWSVDLDAEPAIAWQPGDDILIAIEYNHESILESLISIDECIDTLIVNGVWLTSSCTPTQLWEWKPHGAFGASSGYTTKFSHYKTTKVGDGNDEVTLQTNMRFKDERVFSDSDPKCKIELSFYISNSDTKANNLYVSTHGSVVYSCEYDDGPFDTGWQVIELEFEIPVQDTDWWVVFVTNARLVIDPFPDETTWGGWGWSPEAQWMTQRAP